MLPWVISGHFSGTLLAKSLMILWKDSVSHFFVPQVTPRRARMRPIAFSPQITQRTKYT